MVAGLLAVGRDRDGDRLLRVRHRLEVERDPFVEVGDRVGRPVGDDSVDLDLRVGRGRDVGRVVERVDEVLEPDAAVVVAERERALRPRLLGADHQLVALARVGVGLAGVDHLGAHAAVLGLVVDRCGDRVEVVVGCDEVGLAAGVHLQRDRSVGVRDRVRGGRGAGRVDLAARQREHPDVVGAGRGGAAGARRQDVLVARGRRHLQEAARRLQLPDRVRELVEQAVEVPEQRLLLLEVALLLLQLEDRVPLHGDERRDDRLRVQAGREAPDADSCG